MTNTEHYFLGIGGIGMSSLARWFRVNGYHVAGYDKTPTALTETLVGEGMAVHFDDEVSQIPAGFRDPTHTLVIRTPAVPATHREWAFFQKGSFTILKRSEVLGLLTREMHLLAVAGTHGKTTTSSMVAHVLHHAGRNVAAFLGGIALNFNSNFLLNQPADDLRQVLCVVEADEYDRSFLTLHPDAAVVTSTDADHLDIYGHAQAVLDSFRAFAGQVRQQLFLKTGLPLASATPAEVAYYGFEAADYQARNCRVVNGRFRFDIAYPGGQCREIALRIPGFHNAENATAAFALCRSVGLSPDEIRAGLESYRGVRRRFEYHVDMPEAVLIDDYAHHPAEVAAFLNSVRALYPDRLLTAVFQPHLFSRTRDFHREFGEALSLADRVWLLDIYPAREEPLPGVNSAMLLDFIKAPEKKCMKPEEISSEVARQPPPLLVTMGAGDIDALLPSLKKLLENHV